MVFPSSLKNKFKKTDSTSRTDKLKKAIERNRRKLQKKQEKLKRSNIGQGLKDEQNVSPEQNVGHAHSINTGISIGNKFSQDNLAGNEFGTNSFDQNVNFDATQAMYDDGVGESEIPLERNNLGDLSFEGNIPYNQNSLDEQQDYFTQENMGMDQLPEFDDELSMNEQLPIHNTLSNEAANEASVSGDYSSKEDSEVSSRRLFSLPEGIVQKVVYKGLWMFNAVLLVHLFFSTDGILDYQRMNHQLNKKENYLTNIRHENYELNDFVVKINEDEKFQKWLVRGHLDVLAEDEFLVLFVKKKAKN